MAAETSALPVQKPKRVDHPWLGLLVGALDDRLRQHHGVIEYTRSPECICRMQVVTSSDDLLLRDGTPVCRGERMIALHMWNEQVPPFPAKGPTVGWARRMSRAFDLSLRELALFLSTRREFDDVTAISANLTLASAEHSSQVERLVGRFGFERMMVADAPSLFERMHLWGENVFVLMMVLSCNPASLRTDGLWRDRTLMFLSRRILERRYGPSQRR